MEKIISTADNPEKVSLQKKYLIKNFYDLLCALRENPDWLEELRKLILTEELLNLPKAVRELSEKFDRLEKKVEKIEQDVAVLKQDVAVLKQDVAVLKQDVAFLKQDVEVLKRDVEGLKKDVGVLKMDVASLKGDNFERKVRERAHAFLGKHFRRARIIPPEEWVEKLEDALDQGLITLEERNEALNLDVLVRAKKADTGETFLLAIEASYTADDKDAERALIRADVFYRIYQEKTLPVVISFEIHPALMERFPAVLFIKVEPK